MKGATVQDGALVVTDIVGSTQWLCRLGDERYDELLVCFESLQLAALNRLGGQMLQHQGDGMVAALNSVSDARLWIEEVSEAACLSLGIEVRFGAHYGPCRRRSGGYGGRSFHVLARLAEQAAPGELVMSAAFATVGSWSGFNLDRTRTVLRGFDEPTTFWRWSIAQSEPTSTSRQKAMRSLTRRRASGQGFG